MSAGRGGRGALPRAPPRGGPMGMRGGPMGGRGGIHFLLFTAYFLHRDFEIEMMLFIFAGFSGGFGAPGYVDDGYGGYGGGRGRGGFGAAPAHGFAPGAYGGYGEDEWGGGFGMGGAGLPGGMGGNGMGGAGGGADTELEFSSAEAESTQV